MRLCKTCGETKPLSEWPKNKQGKDGLYHCCKVCKNAKNRKQWHSKSKEQQMVRSSQNRATRCGFEFDLTGDAITIPEICPVLKVPLDSDLYRPSIDRIDNSRGYTADNVRVISLRANILRNNATTEELKLLLEDSERLDETN